MMMMMMMKYHVFLSTPLLDQKISCTTFIIHASPQLPAKGSLALRASTHDSSHFLFLPISCFSPLPSLDFFAFADWPAASLACVNLCFLCDASENLRLGPFVEPRLFASICERRPCAISQITGKRVHSPQMALVFVCWTQNRSILMLRFPFAFHQVFMKTGEEKKNQETKTKNTQLT